MKLNEYKNGLPSPWDFSFRKAFKEVHGVFPSHGDKISFSVEHGETITFHMHIDMSDPSGFWGVIE